MVNLDAKIEDASSRKEQLQTAAEIRFHELLEEHAAKVEEIRIASKKRERKNPPKRRRCKKIAIWVTPEEDKAIRQNAESLRYGSFSEFARTMLLKGCILDVDYEPLNAYTFQMKKLGTNLNQIAKVANTDPGLLTMRDAMELKTLEQELKALIDRMVELTEDGHAALAQKFAFKRRDRLEKFNLTKGEY